MTRLNRDERHEITIVLNGQPVSGFAEPRMLLTDFLREQFGVTGVHVGCEHGVCGACTLHLDGEVVRGCLVLAVQADGRRVDTVEGLTGGSDALTDLQAAFRRRHALQCGYCTPGILMSLSRFLAENPDPSEAEVRDMLSGHLCRCTGYTGIVRAVMDVVAERNANR